MPILAVVGIAEPGERDVLTFSVGDRENQQAWEDLLQDLKERGVKEIGLWVSGKCAQSSTEFTPIIELYEQGRSRTGGSRLWSGRVNATGGSWYYLLDTENIQLL
jgi:transposase-like protein